ncbi:MAG: magnesium transporter [Flavobacteriales bacterium]|jgi:magnesium transporter|nr:magnesium transporter [Flavobacteriales bacterium]MBP9160328.1 magnesium transporter [Flavobacteriales bacterium]
MTFTISKASLERLKELVAQQADVELLAAVDDMHPADIAEVLDNLDLKEAQYLFERLETEMAAEVILEVPEDRREDLLGNYTGKEIAEELIEHIDSDDAADVIAELPDEVRDEVLANISDKEQRSEITELLTYDEHTAGALMAKELVKVNADSSMLDCVRELRQHAEHIDDVYVILVVDEHDRLVGSIPLKMLLTTSLRTPVRDVYEPDIISVKAHEDVEEVSRLMEKYDLVMMPVTDDRGRLLGRITIDDVVDTIREEETEDAQRMAGMGALEYSYSNSSLWEMVKKRSGWLVVLFIGESFTATAMGYFEDQIAKAVVLALFVPLIISSGGNTGSQASTLIIRALAMGDITVNEWWRIFRRESSVGLILGLILAVIGFLRVAVWSQFTTIYGPHWAEVGFVVALTLLGVVVWGNLVGSLFPLVLKRLGLDPATSSAPFVATVVDVTGLVIYFSFASYFLRHVLL